MDFRIIGTAAALGSAFSWAVGAILFKRLGEQISPLGLTLAKGSLSAILLAVILILTQSQGVERQSLFLLILSGLLGISVGDTLFFAALQDLGAHALVLLSTLGEVLTILLAVFFLGERHNFTTWIGILFVISGIAVVLQAKLTEEQQKSTFRGVIFGLLSVLCMSVSIIVAKEALASISAIQATFIRMVSGTLGIFFLGITTQQLGGWIVPLRDFKLVAYLWLSVCFITFGGFWLSLVSIKYVDVSIANTLNTTDPIFVLLLAAIFRHEKIMFKAVIGTILTMIGIILLIKVNYLH
ncbi:DMT family transporter [Crocosphaera sp.]|uniref:DMT family transporter n=1 Tax=Crocosphaera sp. TaxID=2729996 RepID=UPI003F22826F|nr:DMT family transporter [Crocosphaera sp.]